VSFLQGDNVAPLRLPGPGDPSAATATTGTTSASGAPAASLGPAPTTSIDAASIPGTWSVAADSIAGYRVRERLASLTADSDEVGRHPDPGAARWEGDPGRRVVPVPVLGLCDQRSEHRRLRRGRGPRDPGVPGEPRQGLSRAGTAAKPRPSRRRAGAEPPPGP